MTPENGCQKASKGKQPGGCAVGASGAVVVELVGDFAVSGYRAKP